MRADSMTTDIILAETAANRSSISAEDYHAIPALSNSGMKDLAVSPLRYWHRWINPNRSAEEEKDCFVLGSALHCLVLEPSEFNARYCRDLDPDDHEGVLYTIDDCRQWLKDKGETPKGTKKAEIVAQVLRKDPNQPVWDDIKASHEQWASGRTILKLDEFDRVENMAHVLRNEPRMQEILKEGRAEVSLFGKDPDYGVPLKCRLDWTTPGIILDMKSFVTKRGNSVDKSIADAIFFEGYYRQARLYTMVEQQNSGQKPKRYIMAFIESEKPHDVRFKELRPSTEGAKNVYWSRAEIEIRGFCYLYRHCFDRFGVEPWIEEQKIEPLLDEDIRQLAFS